MRLGRTVGVWVKLGLVPIAALIGSIVHDLNRPEVLIVGHVTVDLVDGARPTGGAVSYAAVAAKAFGASSCILTVAGPDADLSVFTGHNVYTMTANSTLTFEHTYAWWGHQRKLRVTANPNKTISQQHVPKWCRRARVVLLGPLTPGDVDAQSFLQPLASFSWWDWLLQRPHYIGLLGQGYQRRLDAKGNVHPLSDPSEHLLAGLGSHVSLFLSDVETLTWSSTAMQRVVARSQRVLVTAGQQGAHEWLPNGTMRHVPPVQVEAVDTNGAGDTFATVYMLALRRGAPDPGAVASWAASRAVLQPQACKPHCAADLLARQEWGREEELLMMWRELLRRLENSLAPYGVDISWLRQVTWLGGA